MRQLFSAIALFASLQLSAQQTDYPYVAVPFVKVQLTDSFWLPRMRTNHLVTIPASFERCERTGRVKNFEMAAAKSGKFCTIFPFDDTDIYKTLEGAAFSLVFFRDPKLEAYMDSLIRKVALAQEEDGYLYTARTIDPQHPHAWSGATRWVKERELSHELYNSGHLFEAAAAHYIATGKRNLLDIALKNADLVCAVFGQDKLHVAPGHEVVEMGLVKLYRITGKKEYLETAKYFIEERGHYSGYNSKSTDPWKNGSYWQDHIPVVDQKEAIGHAVRAGYLYAAMADVAALTGDQKLVAAIDSIWNNLVSKKLYVQGGAGAIPAGERYGDNYELPNATAYNETCAAIANVYWNQRMFQLHGDSKYIDVLEKILYNGLISGLGLDGKSFFYTNAMQVTDDFNHQSLERERSGWFDCSCCPTNLARLIPSIPGYVYAQKGNEVMANLFINSKALFSVNGKNLEIQQQNNYPWNGGLDFVMNPSKSNLAFVFKIRIPGWAQNMAMPSNLYSFTQNSAAGVVLKVNGVVEEIQMDKGYAVINRVWKKGDRVQVQLPMEVRKVQGVDLLKEDKGKLALQRGPLVYCAEGVDNSGKVSGFILPEKTLFTEVDLPQTLGGIIGLKATLPKISITPISVQTQNQPFLAIPYYAWANRGKSEMSVWFPQKIEGVKIISSRE